MSGIDFELKTQPVEKCPLCQSAEKIDCMRAATPVGGVSNYVKCKVCGHIYMDPIPTAESLSEFYEKVYFTPEFRKRDGHSIQDPRQEFAATFMVCEKHLDLIEEHISPPGNFLDVGCSFGGIIAEASIRGWSCTGVEPAAEAVAFCRDRLGLNVLKGDIMELKLPPATFKVITMLEVIEHIPRPIELMVMLTELAADVSVLYMTFPNANSVAGLMYKSDWIGLKPPTHLNFFDYQSIRTLLAGTGWKPIRIKSGGGYAGQLSVIAKKA